MTRFKVSLPVVLEVEAPERRAAERFAREVANEVVALPRWETTQRHIGGQTDVTPLGWSADASLGVVCALADDLYAEAPRSFSPTAFVTLYWTKVGPRLIVAENLIMRAGCPGEWSAYSKLLRGDQKVTSGLIQHTARFGSRLTPEEAPAMFPELDAKRYRR